MTMQEADVIILKTGIDITSFVMDETFCFQYQILKIMHFKTSVQMIYKQ